MGDVLDANKLQAEGQDVDVELFGFESKLVPVSRRLLIAVPYAWRGDMAGICPVGFVPIRTKEECESAARFLSNGDTSASRWPYPHSTIPSGCWDYLNTLYFNNDPAQWDWSGFNGHIKVFCKRDSTAEPTALPTMNPTLSPTLNPT